MAMKDPILAGHSGATLKKVGKTVEKRSPYLANCKDLKRRGQFLIDLSKKFSHMPKILEVKDGVMTYEFVEGEPGFEKADMDQLGKIVRELHTLKLKNTPQKETGLAWLYQLAKENLSREGLSVDLDSVLSSLKSTEKSIVHGEIADLLVDAKGNITILDWDEAGLGSKYHDIGMVYFKCFEQRNGEKDFQTFFTAYDNAALDMNTIAKAGGLIALAYAGFGNRDFRMKFGMDVLNRT